MSEQRNSAWPRRDIEMALFDADYDDTDYGDLADAVIAHLWREAMKPEVIETVSRAIESRHYNADGSLRGIAKGYPSAVIATVLTALLGPNPNEEAVS